MISYPPVIEPRRFYSRPVPTRQTEVTTIWNDGSVIRTNRFGVTEYRKGIPLNMDQPENIAMFSEPEPVADAPVLDLVDFDAAEVSL